MSPRLVLSALSPALTPAPVFPASGSGEFRLQTLEKLMHRLMPAFLQTQKFCQEEKLSFCFLRVIVARKTRRTWISWQERIKSVFRFSFPRKSCSPSIKGNKKPWSNRYFIESLAWNPITDLSTLPVIRRKNIVQPHTVQRPRKMWYLFCVVWSFNVTSEMRRGDLMLPCVTFVYRSRYLSLTPHRRH